MFDADRLEAVRAGGLLTEPVPREGFEAGLRLARAALGATGAFAVVADPESPRILSTTATPESIAASLGGALLDPLVEGRLVDVPAAPTHSRFRTLPSVSGGEEGDGRVGALLAVPIRDPGGRVIAGLCLWQDEPRAWSPADRDLATDAAHELERHIQLWIGAGPREAGASDDALALHRAALVRELERREDWFGVVLDSLPAGVLVARAPEGDPVRANAEFLRLVGADDLASVEVARPLFTAGGDPLDPERHPLRRALRGERVHGDVVCSSADPKRDAAVWWRVNAAPIRARGGDVVGAVFAVEDVTETRGMQEALYRSQEHLLHAQKMEAVGRLAGGMAHDFNNLLTAIMGFGELLLEGMAADDPAREDAHEIVRSASRGRDLTNQLLSFSRRRSTHPAVVDLNEGVASSRRLIERLLDPTVTLETALDPNAGRVSIDRTELEQVVVNLALNARDALPAGGGTVRIETGPVRLHRTLDAEPEAVPAGRWETLAVVDDGAGMDAGLRLRIFEPFFTTKPAGQGTGLGLATVYGIVKRMGGFVRVDSRLGEGTTFRVYLPPVSGEASSPEAAPEPTPAGGTETVLLVEDQEQIRSLLARQLVRSGFAVLEASNGYEALALWREKPEAVDIVVSDVVMPVLDGPSMVAQIRARNPRLPVVFISGYPGAADPSERETPLPDARFLRKPFAAAELIAAIRESLDEHDGS